MLLFCIGLLGAWLPLAIRNLEHNPIPLRPNTSTFGTPKSRADSKPNRLLGLGVFNMTRGKGSQYITVLPSKIPIRLANISSLKFFEAAKKQKSPPEKGCDLAQDRPEEIAQNWSHLDILDLNHRREFAAKLTSLTL